MNKIPEILLFIIKSVYFYFFPVRCIICEGEVRYENIYRICPPCFEKINRHGKREGRFCLKCGRTLTSEKELCMRCRDTEYCFISNTPLWDYSNELIKTLIHNYKFKNYKDASLFLSSMIENKYNSLFRNLAVVPVPCSRKRLKKYGWDHMGLICDRLKLQGIPVFRIIRKKPSKEQKKLSSEERKSAVKNKFSISEYFHPEKLSSYEGVLLIDDIFTTGSTVNECAFILKSAGINNIFILTLALD